MASAIKASFEGLKETRKDLEAVQVGLGREITKALREAATVAVVGARPLTPFDAAHRLDRRDGLPHIRDSLYAIARGPGAAVASKHPGAVVHEYGGTISPRGTPIKIERRQMAHTAGEAALPEISAIVEQRIDALIARRFA